MRRGTGRWIGVLVAVALVGGFLVLLTIMQRQLKRIAGEREPPRARGEAAPTGPSAPGKAPTKSPPPDSIPPGAIW